MFVQCRSATSGFRRYIDTTDVSGVPADDDNDNDGLMMMPCDMYDGFYFAE